MKLGRLFLSLHATEIVKAAYRGVLGREPDPEGLAAYVEALRGSRDLTGLLADLISSAEFWEKTIAERASELVNATYNGVLGREPDTEGLAAYAGTLSGTRDLAAIIADILRSDEFKAKYLAAHTADLARAPGAEPDPEAEEKHVAKLAAALAPELVRGAYRGLLGREPDSAGRGKYVELLLQENGGGISTPLARVLSDITRSEEFAGLRSKSVKCPNPAGTYDDPCLVFLHIEKTAGTSIQNHLAACFGRGIYKEHGDSLYTRSPGELSKYSVFAGHFNHDSFRYIPRKNLSMFTFVRDPKKRLLSLYYFWRAHEPGHPSFHWGMEKANRLTAEEFFEDRDVQTHTGVWNHMSWAIMGERLWRKWHTILTSTADEAIITGTVDKEIRPEIRKRLDEFIFIGLQEDFDRSVEGLFRILGKEPPAVKRADHTLELLMNTEPNFKKSVEKQPMNARLDAGLDRLVHLDNIVYDEASDLYSKRLCELDKR